VVDLAINNILGQLDPHSVYINQDELEYVEQSMKGSFVGIGITFNIFNDTLAVIKSLPEGPAKEAGIEAGDRISYAVFCLKKKKKDKEIIRTAEHVDDTAPDLRRAGHVSL